MRPTQLGALRLPRSDRYALRSLPYESVAEMVTVLRNLCPPSLEPDLVDEMDCEDAVASSGFDETDCNDVVASTGWSLAAATFPSLSVLWRRN